MNSLNIAKNIANDNSLIGDGVSNYALKSVVPSSNQLSETGKPSEMATPLGAGRFQFQGNDAQFDIHRKTSMSDSDKLTDAKIEAVEARTDTKIERLGGKIDV